MLMLHFERSGIPASCTHSYDGNFTSTQQGTVTDKGANVWQRYSSLSNAGYEPDGNKKTNQDSFFSINEFGEELHLQAAYRPPCPPQLQRHAPHRACVTRAPSWLRLPTVDGKSCMPRNTRAKCHAEMTHVFSVHPVGLWYCPSPKQATRRSPSSGYSTATVRVDTTCLVT